MCGNSGYIVRELLYDIYGDNSSPRLPHPPSGFNDLASKWNIHQDLANCRQKILTRHLGNGPFWLQGYKPAFNLKASNLKYRGGATEGTA